MVDLEAEWKTVDPDQLATEKPPDPDLRCFFKTGHNLAQQDKGLKDSKSGSLP